VCNLYGFYYFRIVDFEFLGVSGSDFIIIWFGCCEVCVWFFIYFFGFSQVFAESQDYGIHGERVRNACWGYLCQSGAIELKEVRFDAIV